MKGPRTVLGKARGDTAEQAFERFPFARGQAVQQRRERRRSSGENSVGRTRPGIGEHECDRAPIRPLHAAHQPTRLEPIDQPNGGRLRPAYDAGEIVHRAARPRLQMNESAGLRLAQI